MNNYHIYEGDEHLEFKGKELPYTLRNYWQINLSALLFNLIRGGLAEFIVLCALNDGGYDCIRQVKLGIEEYDIDGPNKSRIEVKCIANVQIDTPDEKEPVRLLDSQLKFDIKQKGKQDLYVLCYYKAETKSENILNLDLWDFYVLPTSTILSDKDLANQTSVSIWKLRHLSIEPCKYDELCSKIVEATK